MKLKSFKEYDKEKHKDIPFLSWDSSHAEIRNKDKEPSTLDWDSSHAEMRDKKPIKEEWHGDFTDEDTSHHTKMGEGYNGKFHDHPDVKPKNLSIAHQSAIHRYTNVGSNDEHGYASSANMNAYLRNRSGDLDKTIRHHGVHDVEHAVKTLSSAFKPENTNRKPIITYGGVPKHIADKLTKAGPESDHHLAGFTSTSSAQRTAGHFATAYNNMDHKKPKHVIKYHIKPGAGLSAVHNSEFAENEVILHHGAKITYHKTTEHKDHRGNPVFLHHVTVHNEHKPLEKYDKYKE